MEPLLVKGLLRRIPVVTPRRAKGTIGVLAECYGIWERRSPLTPKHVAGLVQGGHRVLVQPSPRRVFRDAEFAAAGAEVTADLSDCDAVLGVKQPAVSNECTLVDYECIVKPGLVEHGVSSPLLGIAPARYYGTLVDALKAVARAGEALRRNPCRDPVDGNPFVVSLVGDGRVSVGAQQVFDALGGGARLVDDVGALAARFERGGTRAPHDRLPEFARLRGVADLGCDVGGSVECLERTTTPDLPCYSYDATKRTVASPDTASGGDFFVLGVDILPAELPREASQHFGDALIGLVPALAAEPPSRVARAARAATILEKGALTKPYAYVDELRGARGRASEAPAGALTAAGRRSCASTATSSTAASSTRASASSSGASAPSRSSAASSRSSRSAETCPRRRRCSVSLPGGEAGLADARGLRGRGGAPDADADLTLLPAYCRGHYAKTIAHQ
ncbi:saccharopine dehydrogenase [Aureococcus anophagefferens]|nr:saccharopine dehydrogenase [Aureococcus anophagefferens]